MNEELQPPGERHADPQPAQLDAGPSGPRSVDVLIPLCLSLFFLILVMWSEAWALSILTDSGAIPGLYWRLIWPLFFLGAAALFPFRARMVFLGISGLFLTGLAVVDAAYFRFFGSVPSLESAGTAGQLWDVRDSVIALISGFELALFVPYSVFFIAAAYAPRIVHSNASHARSELLRIRGLTAALLFAAAFGNNVKAWRTPIIEQTHHIKESDWVMPADHWGSRYSRATKAATFGLFTFHYSDLMGYMKEAPADRSLEPYQLRIIDQVLDAKKNLNDLATPFFGLANGRRIIVIQLEAVQHWVLGLEVDGVPAMPNLDRLRKSALSWDYIMDITATGRTSDAEFAVMTGLLPDARLRTLGLGTKAQSPQYLGRILRSKGYRLASYHGYKRSFWDRAYNHPFYGIAEMYFEEVYDTSETLGLGVPDPFVYDFMVDKLEDEREEKSLSLMISLSSHHPFIYTPEEYNSHFASLDPHEGWGLVGPYLRSVRYSDDALGAFLDQLEERGLLEDSLLVIYGDHDMGFVGLDRPVPGSDRIASHAGEDRVPLVIAIPGQEELIAKQGPEHTDATGGLHDLLPTLLHLLGEEAPRGIVGTNLLVPDRYRGAVPLPPGIDGRVFAFRHNLIFEKSGEVLPIEAGQPVPTHGPTVDQAYLDQLVSQALKDHPEAATRAPAETPAPEHVASN